jgi:hypothetical protein
MKYLLEGRLSNGIWHQSKTGPIELLSLSDCHALTSSSATGALRYVAFSDITVVIHAFLHSNASINSRVVNKKYCKLSESSQVMTSVITFTIMQK